MKVYLMGLIWVTSTLSFANDLYGPTLTGTNKVNLCTQAYKDSTCAADAKCKQTDATSELSTYFKTGETWTYSETTHLFTCWVSITYTCR